LRRLGVGALLSLALVGCSGGGEAERTEDDAGSGSVVGGPSGSPDPREIPTPEPAPTATPEEACGGYPFDADAVRAYTPEGPAFAGDGVHPVELFAVGPRPYEGAGPGLPDDWVAVPFNGPAQLVVCEYQNGGHDGAVVGTCSYAGGSFGGNGESEVRAARYTYRVFEAGTGEPVDTFTLDGTTGPDASCPDSSYAPAPTYYQLVESDALADALRPLVVGPA
jgi:hypothetical protein